MSAATKTQLPTRVRLFLADRGQDFLWFDVEGDAVVGCGPCRGELWIGLKIIPPEKWETGAEIVFRESGKTLRYSVARAVTYPTKERQ